MRRRDPDEFLETFGALARSVRSVAAQAYADFEVGSTQAKFLRHIGRNSCISQAELARATVTDPALAGRVLDTLVERGWVERTRSDADRRQYVLELTASGQRARKRVDEARRQVAERMVAALEDRDISDFERIAKRLLAALERSAAP